MRFKACRSPLRLIINSGSSLWSATRSGSIEEASGGVEEIGLARTGSVVVTVEVGSGSKVDSMVSEVSLEDDRDIVDPPEHESQEADKDGDEWEGEEVRWLLASESRGSMPHDKISNRGQYHGSRPTDGVHDERIIILMIVIRRWFDQVGSLFFRLFVFDFSVGGWRICDWKWNGLNVLAVCLPPDPVWRQLCVLS